MTKRVLLALLFIILLLPVTAVAGKKFTLVIDAGHGGRDTGAPGTMSVEKNINLNVALAFGKYVEQNCPDVKVVYTRKTDVFIPLYERAEIANRAKADLFISVHTNALKGVHTARGFETYTLGDGRSHATATNLEVAKRENSVIFLEKDYRQHYVGFDPNSPESNIMFEFIQDKNLSKSIDMAKMLQNHVCREANRPNKGVHQQNLAVLRLTSMPACLIELGYISTPDEEQMLNDRSKVDLISRAIYNAFAEYKNKYDTGITVPFKPQSQALAEPENAAPVASADVQPDERATRFGTPDTTAAERRSSNAAASRNRSASATRDRQSKSASAQPEAGKSQANTTSAKPKSAAPRSNERKPETSADASRPVFKVQIFVSKQRLKNGDSHLKQLDNVDFFQEGGLYKYTCGASNNYNEIFRLRKELMEKFPGAFVIAFKNGEKMDVNEGIREFKRNRNARK